MRESWVVIALTAACSFHGAPLGGDGGGSGGGDGGIDGGIDATSDARTLDGPASTGNRRRITFLDATSAAPLVKFPVLLRLDATTIDYGAITNPRTGLAFFDPDGTKLPFDVDTWNPAGESDIWVAVPQIDASNTDYITMEFGTGVQPNFDPQATWSSSYAYVMHLGSQLVNVAAPSIPGVPTNVGIAAGKIGEASTFAGTGAETVAFPDSGPLFDTWSAFTLELWLYPNYTATPSGEPAVIGKGTTVANGRLINAGTTFQTDFVFQSGTEYLNTPVTWKQWNQLVYTYNGTTFAIYHDGALVESISKTGNLANSGNTMQLGGGAPIKGAIDELHVAHAGRNADWIRAEYLAATGQFVAITTVP